MCVYNKINVAALVVFGGWFTESRQTQAFGNRNYHTDSREVWALQHVRFSYLRFVSETDFRHTSIILNALCLHCYLDIAI